MMKGFGLKSCGTVAVTGTLLLSAGFLPQTVHGLCITTNDNTFTVKVNMFAGELGYYMFEECGDIVNPTIGMKVGETYTFVQADRSNYFHALGFSYVPDGAHADAPELEPAVSASDTAACIADATCPAPMYMKDDQYLGVYSNIPEIAPVTTGEEDFGLDVYEPEFFYPLGDWAGAGTYSIKLRFDDTTVTQDIFYFCHIHQFMSGRIKLLDDTNTPINPTDTPELGYEYDTVNGLDAGCGTFGLNDFMLPNDQCPAAFVCDHESSSISLFAQCIEAMNCNMLHGMTTGVSSGDPVALFIHQMIPHHQNAVNMAKALLNTNKLKCENLTNEDDPNFRDCELEIIVRSIITGQNFEIQTMRNALTTYELPASDNCQVEITESSIKQSSAVSHSMLPIGKGLVVFAAISSWMASTFL